MAAMSAGTRVKGLATRKTGTPHTKAHRFEPFSQRIARLKVDPVHKVRRSDLDLPYGEHTATFFRARLEHWVELNLSENFINFSRKASPLCESLPQLLHHEDQIMILLAEHIDKGDALSMEPLLNLLAEFAHDLGPKFEKHFSGAVTLVASVAATRPAPEVIEWSFTCLAWIFKFLSRLLVPDLRELLRIMLPYLGKTRQKYFVTKFAAESLAFLVRKAGSLHHRNAEPLDRAVSVLLADLCEIDAGVGTASYEEGLMSLFSEATCGVSNGIHSSGGEILSCLLRQVTRSEDRDDRKERVISGVLIRLVHHTNAESIQPIFDTVKHLCQTLDSDSSSSEIRIGVRSLFLLVVTRKGSRISNWQHVSQTCLHLAELANKRGEGSQYFMQSLVALIACAMQYMPMNDLLPYLNGLMNAMSHDLFRSHFLSFCDLSAKLDPGLFQSTMIPFLQSFMAANWGPHEVELSLLLSELAGRRCLESHTPGSRPLAIPEPWLEHVLDQLRTSSPTTNDIARLESYLKVIEVLPLASNSAAAAALRLELHDRVKKEFGSDASQLTLQGKFAAGQCFKTYTRIAKQQGELDRSLWPSICASAAAFGTLELFLQGILDFVDTNDAISNSSESALAPLLDAMISNLSGTSHDIRLFSLEILRSILNQTRGHELPAISLAITIESSPINLQTMRTVSMHIRKLASLYKDIRADELLVKIIPKYCFGLFSMKSSQTWQDACQALSVVCEYTAGERIVADTASQWLQRQSDPTAGDHVEGRSNQNARKLTQHECSNVLSIEQSIADTFRHFEAPLEGVMRTSEDAHTMAPLTHPLARLHALQVLNSIPQVAEKRSRLLVPIFLSWTGSNDDAFTAVDNSSRTSVTLMAEEPSDLWSLRDRKAMIELFGKFTNPKVLYRSEEVYDALLDLLTVGNADLQKVVLQALFTWKHAGIQKHQETLLNILDDARFREEIAVFLDFGDDHSNIDQGHREELMPLLLRLLYGKVVARSGTKSGHGGQDTRRKAVLRAISRLQENEFRQFLPIAFGSLADVRLIENGELKVQVLSHSFMPTSKQQGLVRMIETMFATLQSQMTPFAEKAANAVLYCLVRASRELAKSGSVDDETITKGTKISVLRNIRQTSLSCLDLIFANSEGMQWAPYLPLLFEEVITPGLDNFASENAQAISRLLKLFGTWASSLDLVSFFWLYNKALLPRIADCLGAKYAQDEVRLFVLEAILLQTIHTISEVPTASISKLNSYEGFHEYVPHILSQLGALLQSDPSRKVLASGIQTLSSLAPYVQGSAETGKLIVSTTRLLGEPANRVSPKTKGDLLIVLERLLSLRGPSDIEPDLYLTVCASFDYFRDIPNRLRLCQVLATIASTNADLVQVADLCGNLNARSTKALDQVDFDRCLAAFSTINEQMWDQLTPKQWRPLLFNLVYFLRNAEDFAIRSNAAFGLKRFVDSSFANNQFNQVETQDLVLKVLLPSLRNGMKSSSELVRAEHVSVMGHLISRSTGVPELDDMKVLLVNDDEEASFFNNVLHIQQHRRLRSLRRLTGEVGKGLIHSTNISLFFLPLLEHFLFDQGDQEAAHNLTGETIITIGTLLQWLEWNQFKAVLRRYRGYMESKTGVEKTVIRLLGHGADALNRAVQEKRSRTDNKDIEMEGNANHSPSCLAASLPSTARLTEELVNNHISPLSGFIHNKDESEISLRVPIAVTTVKLLNLLPDDKSALLLPPVLMDVCNILRSRSQDSRDVARRTLAEMTIIMGPSYLRYVLKELRTSLARGYQLHVLSFTVHSILLATADHFQRGDLDASLPMLVAIIIDDIFGTVGQEKDAEDYVSKMKEVKSSKSFDSMELLARSATIKHFGNLIRPVQSLLAEKLNAKLSTKIDELLRRIGLGISHNPDAASRDLLMFAYEVVQGVYRSAASDSNKQPQHSSQDRRLVNLNGAKRGMYRGSTSSYTFKLTRFAFDLLRSVLHKHEDLLTPTNLHGFIPMIGDAMVEGHEEVKIPAMRLLSAAIKLPMKELDQNAELYSMEAIKIIRGAPSTNSEAAQAALKLVASIIRERSSTTIRESDIAYLLQRLQPDLEEPDRQGVTFNFVKAVLARKMVIPEIYEVMDHVGTMMVTNHTKGTRDVAKGVYVHFLMEYPQAKNRWSKQLKFFVKNLDYEYPEGRQAIMEAVHVLLTKVGDTLAQDMVGTFFLPVVMRLANDDSNACRELAAVLLGEIFSRADPDNLKSIMSVLHTWLEQEGNPLLVGMALQAYRILFGTTVTIKDAEVAVVKTTVEDIILAQVSDKSKQQWEMLFYALQLFATLVMLYPSTTMDRDSAFVWSGISDALAYPHAWVKHSAANLVGSWFHDLGRNNGDTGLGALPLTGSYGLQFREGAMIDVLKSSLRALRQPAVTEGVALQMQRNLVFLGRCLNSNGLYMNEASTHGEDTESEGDFDVSEEEDGAEEQGPSQTALQYLFGQVSFVLRQEPRTTRALSLVPKTAMLQILGALCNHLTSASLTASLPRILLPLLHLTDPDIAAPHSSDPEFDTAYKALTRNSHEVLDLLQKKLGTTEFIAQSHAVQKSIRERREGRKAKRRIKKVSAPEKFGREKKRKEEKKKEKRKERAVEHRGKRRGW